MPRERRTGSAAVRQPPYRRRTRARQPHAQYARFDRSASPALLERRLSPRAEKRGRAAKRAYEPPPVGERRQVTPDDASDTPTARRSVALRWRRRSGRVREIARWRSDAFMRCDSRRNKAADASATVRTRIFGVNCAGSAAPRREFRAQAQCFEQAALVGNALARDVECGAMIDRRYG